MKYVMIATLMLFSAFASAAGNTKNGIPDSAPTSLYEHLDVQKVLSITHDSSSVGECNPVKTHMTYQDSKGAEHTLSYMEFSPNNSSCQNG